MFSGFISTVRYKCRCGEVIASPRTFVNSDSPALCPICLVYTWLVMPKGSNIHMAITASDGAHDQLSLLNAEAGQARKQAREILEKQKARRDMESN